MSKPKKVLAWHFIRPGFALGYGDTRIPQVGEWLEVPGPVEVCKRGLHASIRASDALEHCQWDGGMLCRVEMGGEIAHHEDGTNLVATKRRILWSVPADPLLGQWMLHVATRALEQHCPDAPDACWQALDLLAAMLAGIEVDDADGAAAWAAAGDAAWDAAWAAAWDVARAAARAAAGNADGHAAWDDQNDELERLAVEAHESSLAADKESGR